MGILNRTPDSFYDHGSYFAFDRFLAHAERLVQEGADILDVGGVKAGPGPEVSEEEELERVVPAIAALAERFDVALSVDTWKASVAAEAFAAGACIGNDISGFSDPAYLSAAAKAGAAVVATHIRLAPRVADPDPHYGDLWGDVSEFLAERAGRACAAGIPPSSVILDAGLDLGKTSEQSVRLLAATPQLVAMGYPVLLSASNKTFLGSLVNREVGERGAASLAAATLGLAMGASILRVHDVAGTRRVCATMAGLAAARP